MFNLPLTFLHFWVLSPEPTLLGFSEPNGNDNEFLGGWEDGWMNLCTSKWITA